MTKRTQFGKGLVNMGIKPWIGKQKKNKKIIFVL